MVQGWGWRMGGMEHAAAFKCLKTFIWTRNRLALQYFKGWKKYYSWKLERRKISLNMCQSILIVAVLTRIYKPSAKLFFYMTVLIYFSFNPYISSVMWVLLSPPEACNEELFCLHYAAG